MVNSVDGAVIRALGVVLPKCDAEEYWDFDKMGARRNPEWFSLG
jgi:hypothetical protein